MSHEWERLDLMDPDVTPEECVEYSVEPEAKPVGYAEECVDV